MSVLHWQLPSSSSSSPFCREAKARHEGAAVSWQRPLLGKAPHTNLLCKTSTVVQATLTWVWGLWWFPTRYDLHWTMESVHPAPCHRDNICCLHMAASSRSCIPLQGLSLLHLFPFCLCPLLFQAFSSSPSMSLGASNVGTLGARRKRQETCGKVSSRKGKSFHQNSGFLQEFKTLEQHRESARAIFPLLNRDSP